jgi:hypothetical protein
MNCAPSYGLRPERQVVVSRQTALLEGASFPRLAIAVQPNPPKGSWGHQRAATIGKIPVTFALMERTLFGIMRGDPRQVDHGLFR